MFNFISIQSVIFKKEGLPHMHLFVTLRFANKVKIVVQIDRFTTVETHDASKHS